MNLVVGFFVVAWLMTSGVGIHVMTTTTLALRASWGEDVDIMSASGCVRAVMEASVDSACSVIYISDGTPFTTALIESLQLHYNTGPRVTAIIELLAGEDDNNSTQHYSILAPLARQVRQRSWCSVVVVVSESPTFLARVAEWSLKGRLLVWSTKMLVVTRLALDHLLSLLPYHWTFSMMNTVVLNLEHPRPNTSERCVVHSHLPYSDKGAREVQVASWSQIRGLDFLSTFSLFPQKFDNFHSAYVTVTALPYKPFWHEVKTEASDGSQDTHYSGSDYQLLQFVATALNFTPWLYPVTSWITATDLVAERVSFMCAIYHILMTTRMEWFEYTVVYEYSLASFVSAKPGLSPQWQSVYYPLTGQVWLTVLASILVIPCVIYMIKGVRPKGYGGTLGVVVQDMTGLLLGQNLPPHLPRVTSTRILVAFWLIYALILSASYRGNLTASLTVPKYPPRVETLSQLVNTFDRLTIPAYGEQHRKFYSESDSPLFQALARMLIVGPPPMEGLKSVSQREAHLGGRRFLQQKIAEEFTEADGSTKLYVGREVLFPGPSGWPIPHNAPYKQQLDYYITAAIEAGLYEKWVSDMSTQAVLDSRRRQQQQKQHLPDDSTVQESEADRLIPALTIIHLQGPFIILLIGLVLGALILIIEVCWYKIQ